MSQSILWTLAACTQMTGYVEPPPPTTGTEPTATLTPTGTTEENRLVSGLTISKVSIYQGVEIVLVEDGAEVTGEQAPVVAGRDAFLRVFVDPDDDWDPRRVRAVLTVQNNSGDIVLEETQRVEVRSTDADRESTINFDLDGGDLHVNSEFVVELFEATDDGPGGGRNKDAKWRSESTGGIGAEETDDLTVVLIPIRYNADGSGRLPDTGAAQVARIDELVRGIYPAKDVTVRVDPPVDWNFPVSPLNSGQWGNLLAAVNELRDDANEEPNTYYYGMFNGEDTINQYCQFGCILGLSLLAYTASDPYFRASIGIGYTGNEAAETLVHEVGHAHGRDHAPCGVSPSDRDYPYANASIGSWGYDIVDATLYDPDNFVDMMSYCYPLWVSDYTYRELHQRIQIVKGQARSARIERQAISVFGDGTAIDAGRMTVTPGSGSAITLDLFDEDGRFAGVGTGSFFPYDHIEGGVVAMDTDLPAGWTAQAQALPTP